MEKKEPVRGKNRIRSVLWKIERGINQLDGKNLWWIGLLLQAVVFVPYLLLGTGSVFEIHDQLDETLMTYVLNARHPGSEIFEELLGGINASGMQPSALLFIPLYRIFPTFTAFLLQYAIVFAAGFYGMYLCVRKLTKSSILSVLIAGCYSMLPIQPVYGLSVLGVPLCLYAFLCLKEESQKEESKSNFKQEKKAGAFLILLFFGLTTHLILIGYVVLTFAGLALVGYTIQNIRKRRKLFYGTKWLWAGCIFLGMVYVAANHSLFLELLLGDSSYVSHRAEQINYGEPVWNNIREVFLNSAQHVPSLHQYLILPILATGVLKLFSWKRLEEGEKKKLALLWVIFLSLAASAVLYGICNSQWAADWKNRQEGFLRYFQLERYYWVYPAGWYLAAALAASLWLTVKEGRPRSFRLALVILVLLPTAHQILYQSNFYKNVNQWNNGSGVTGYISWESYYAKELMKEIDEAIGRDKSEYRVAHLGISPAPSLMYGFYTVDGYSNNYPLEYKHRFRKVIEKELEKGEEATRLYFDTWGSRCYLFNSQSGTYYSLSASSGAVYEGLEFDMEALKDLGCEYLFSGGQILDASRMNLEEIGNFKTKDSYWRIWLYRLK